MILIGQYDSPFVRRTGIALKLYGIAFEHRPWSAFSDAFRIRPYNPLIRVPTLVLDTGETLVESHYILDYLDGLMPEEARLLPAREPARRMALKIVALATGLGDKAVSLFYEQRMHHITSDSYVERLKAQIDGALEELEGVAARRATSYLTGESISHADIAVAVMWKFVSDAHPGLVCAEDCPTIAAMSERLEALPAFREISQPFVPPA